MNEFSMLQSNIIGYEQEINTYPWSQLFLEAGIWNYPD